MLIVFDQPLRFSSSAATARRSISGASVSSPTFCAPLFPLTVRWLTDSSLCGYPPFYEEDQTRLFETILRGKFEFHAEYWAKISDYGTRARSFPAAADRPAQPRTSSASCSRLTRSSVSTPRARSRTRGLAATRRRRSIFTRRSRTSSSSSTRAASSARPSRRSRSSTASSAWASRATPRPRAPRARRRTMTRARTFR